MNRVLAVIASVTLLATTAIAGDRARDPVTASTPISFKLQLEASGSRFELRLSMGPRSNMSTQVSHEQLGLNNRALEANGPVRFAIAREPGRLDCAGDADKRIATGNCTFTPAIEFARYLAGRGIGEPSFRESFDLTLVGANKALVEALAQADYPKPTIDQLVALSALHVTPAYVADLARQGFRPDNLEDLTAFAALGIDADYAGKMLRAGLGKLSGKNLIELKALGISPEFLSDMAGAGLRNLTADQAVQLKAIGVTPAYIRELAAIGYVDLPVNRLVEMKAVGVTAEDVRRARKIGIAQPTPDQLVQLRTLRN